MKLFTLKTGFNNSWSWFRRVPDRKGGVTFMNILKLVSICLFAAILLTSCAGLTPQQQRILTGGAIGAAGSAAIGAISGGSPGIGALVGGAVGAAGGAIVHEMEIGNR
jgi:osmotically inducible lipoprotein OsmB